MKKLCSQIIYEKMKMRALWSQTENRSFFGHPALTFCKMDILKMSKIDLAPPDWKNYLLAVLSKTYVNYRIIE
jgi:hypothetical protein